MIENDRGYIYSNPGDLEPGREILLENELLDIKIPGLAPINQKWRLRSEIVSCDAVEEVYKENEDNYCAFLDAEMVGEIIDIRKWKSGDRFAPLGLSGHTIKLSDFWINNKMPKRFRENWPLIFSNEKKLDLIVLSKAASDLAQETEDPGLLGVLSDWLITKQQWKPAVELCEELNQLDPLDLTHKTRTETLHLTLLGAGNKQEAKRLFHKAIEFYKLSNRAQENIAAYKKMVTCYALLGESAQQKGAESQLRQLKFKIEQDTREQNIANLMQEAQLLLNRKEYHGAIRLLKEAFSHNKSSENYRALAAVYKKLHWSRALKDLNDQWQDLQTNSERKTKS